MADLLSKVKRLYDQVRPRVVSLRAIKVSELREKIDKLKDEVNAKDQELLTISGHVAKTAMLRKEAGKLLEISKRSETNVAVISGLQEEVSDVKKVVAELLPFVEKSRDGRVDAGKTFFLQRYISQCLSINRRDSTGL